MNGMFCSLVKTLDNPLNCTSALGPFAHMDDNSDITLSNKLSLLIGGVYLSFTAPLLGFELKSRAEGGLYIFCPMAQDTMFDRAVQTKFIEETSMMRLTFVTQLLYI